MTCIEAGRALSPQAGSLRQSPGQQGLEVIGSFGQRQILEQRDEVVIGLDAVGLAVSINEYRLALAFAPPTVSAKSHPFRHVHQSMKGTTGCSLVHGGQASVPMRSWVSCTPRG